MNSTMRASCAVFLLVLVVGSCFSEASARRNAKSRNKAKANTTKKTKKRASASAHSVSHGGRSSAIAVSRSRAYEEVKNVVKEIHDAVTAEAHDETELVALAAAEVEARGLAFAAAFAGAYVQVEVEGFGEACGSADASARAEATAFAEAVAGALAEVENELGIADANAIAEALSVGVARAVAKAYADACTAGGFAEATQESLSVAIVQPIARAIAAAIAGVDGEGSGSAEAFTDSESTVLETVNTSGTSNTNANGESDAISGGRSNARTAQIFPCEDKYTACCSKSALRNQICACKLSPGNFGCFAVPDIQASSDKATVWADRLSKHTCFCAH